MRYVQHVLAGLGMFLAALGAGAVWWVITLDTSVEIEVVGSQADPALWSIALVVLASYGLQFVLGRTTRRLIAALQIICSLCVGWLAWISPRDLHTSATAQIARLSGISGDNGVELIQNSTVSGWHLAVVMASLLFATSGIFGILRKDMSGQASRFVTNTGQSKVEDSVTAWDALSDGVDPTHR